MIEFREFVYHISYGVLRVSGRVTRFSLCAFNIPGDGTVCTTNDVTTSYCEVRLMLSIDPGAADVISSHNLVVGKFSRVTAVQFQYQYFYSG